jgi:hypothetical protein
MSDRPDESEDHRLDAHHEDVGVREAFLPTNSRQPSSEEAATAPPIFLLILPYLSLGLAIFIAGTRYFDFRNHGFDVLAGAFFGTASASFSYWVFGRNAFRKP